MKSLLREGAKPTEARIGVLFPGALGDFVCLLPVLQSLVREAEVDLFARTEFAGLVPPGVRVRSLERPEIHALFVDGGADEKPLQDFFGEYQAIFSWLGSRQPQFVERLQCASRGKAKTFPFRPDIGRMHQIDYYVSCLNGHLAPGRDPAITPCAAGVRWCADFYASHALHQRPVLALAPGSGAREKNWPEEFFVAVAEWWRVTVQGNVVLLLGPVEEERGSYQQLRRRCVTASGLRLFEVAALLHASAVYLGNDSGVSHVAAAAGVRTVVLFGPSPAMQWAPRGKRVTIIRRRDIRCSPCSPPIMKACSHHACLTGLFPREVIDVLAQLPDVVTLTRAGAGIRV
jgi:Glycosyltransferase family 9 (heptosyltransferase)